MFEVVRTSPHYIRPMARRMRAAAAVSLQGYGFDPRRALHRVVLDSAYCRTAKVDGEVVAMWGIVAPVLASTAYVWLVMSDEIAKVPRFVVQTAKEELAEMMETYEEVATTVLPDDEAAIRFALYLGFHDNDDEEPASHKVRAQRLRENPRHRIPIGDHFVIALGYHGVN